MSEGLPFFGVPARVWDGLTRVITMASVVAVTGGLWLALIEYREAKRISQVSATMSLIERWDSGKLDLSWSCLEVSVSAALETRQGDIEIAVARKNQGIPDAFSDIYKEVSADVLADQNRCHDHVGNPSVFPAIAFQLVLAHMRELSLCLESRICNLQTARTYYGDTVDDLTVIFADPLQSILASNPRQARGLFDVQDLFAHQ